MSPSLRRVFLTFCVFVLMVLVLVAGGLGIWEARRFFDYPTVLARFDIENWQLWEFHDYFNLDQDDVSLVWNDRRLADVEVFSESGNYSLTLEFIQERIDPFLFWDEGVQALITDMGTLRPGASQGMGRYLTLLGDTLWIDIRFLDSFLAGNDFLDSNDFLDWQWQEAYNILIVTDTRENSGRPATVISRRADVRYRPDRTAFITHRAVNGENLITFGIEGEGTESEATGGQATEVQATEGEGSEGEYIRVRTEDGLLGYVLRSDIEFTGPEWQPPTPPPAPPPSNITLTWEMITAPIGNETAMNNPLPEGLDVISPTWFNFDPDLLDGTIISFASREYVEWAHAQGTEVWAKVFDGNFDISNTILTDYYARQWAIYQLINFVQEYNLDGININFEHIRSANGGYYVRFLRDLSRYMQEIGAVLSVATFVPAPWFTQYHHELVGKTVDFVAIMTYDEHYGGSENPGPVASLPFVERWITETLQLIPREKVLLGLPFYNRLWRVNPDGSHTSTLHGMIHPWNLVEEWDVVPIWDHVVGSYYVNFPTDDGVTYRMWIECARSIGEKMRVFREFELAGVAGWRRGLEGDLVWDEIFRNR